jgi:hypothetical protein
LLSVSDYHKRCKAEKNEPKDCQLYQRDACKAKTSFPPKCWSKTENPQYYLAYSLP